MNLNYCILFLFLALFSCDNSTGQDTNEDDQNMNSFNTPTAAIAKAKADLINIAEQYPHIDLNIDAKQLNTSTNKSILDQFLINFEELMASDSISNFQAIVQSKTSNLIPFQNNGKVIATAEIADDDGQWRVNGLSNAAMRNDLNALPETIIEGGFSNVQVYEIPNLQATLYCISQTGEQVCYTNYNDQYSLREAVPAKQIFQVLKNNAIRFNREFGDELSKQELVK